MSTYHYAQDEFWLNLRDTLSWSGDAATLGRVEAITNETKEEKE